MSNITIIVDIEAIDLAFGEDSPFNLKRDAKKHNLDEEDLETIGKDIADEIKHGFGRPACAAMFWTKTGKGNYSKIRVGDEERNCGKSNGYRCVVLWDSIAKKGFLLHIFEHKNKDNLTHAEKNKLKTLVEQYILGKYKEL